MTGPEPRPEVGGLLTIRTPDGRVLHCVVTAVRDWADAAGGHSTEVRYVADPFGPQWPDPERPGRPAQP